MRKAEQISDQEQFSEVMREIHEQLFEFLTVHTKVAAGRERTQTPQSEDLGRSIPPLLPRHEALLLLLHWAGPGLSSSIIWLFSMSYMGIQGENIHSRTLKLGK